MSLPDITPLDKLAASWLLGQASLTLSAPGQGKREWIRALAERLARRFGRCVILAADPGNPGWGPPTAVGLIVLEPGPDGALSERVTALAAVDSLDPVRRPGRYLAACLSLRRRAKAEPALLVDAPSLVRPPIAEGFLADLDQVLAPDWLLIVGVGSPVERVAAAVAARPGLRRVALGAWPGASPVSKSARRAARTARWAAYLAGGQEHTVSMAALRVSGRIPESDDWVGRVVAFEASDGRTMGLGEVVGLDEARSSSDSVGVPKGLRVRTPLHRLDHVATLRVASAARRRGGHLKTVLPVRARPSPVMPTWTLPSRGQQPIPTRWPEAAGQAPWEPRFLNPLTGDPALLVRHVRSGRALLFDIGWLDPLPTRLLHAVTDLFVSHAHMDHLQGLVVLLRVLLGPGGRVRLYGPPGLSGRVSSLFETFDFGLLDGNGPVFLVHELGDEVVQRTRMQCAAPPHVERLDSVSAPGGLLLDEPNLCVRAAHLEHGAPVLAYRFACRRQRDLPGGRRLDREYVLTYVTDAADTPRNRGAILELARGSDLFVCEAAFSEAYAERARETGHLTARACGELALAAEVGRLVPFHFSARHHAEPARVYREVMGVFDRVVPAVGVGSVED